MTEHNGPAHSLEIRLAGDDAELATELMESIASQTDPQWVQLHRPLGSRGDEALHSPVVDGVVWVSVASAGAGALAAVLREWIRQKRTRIVIVDARNGRRIQIDSVDLASASRALRGLLGEPETDQIEKKS